MKGIQSINVLECPACGSSDIHLTCTRLKGHVRIRYKRCKSCFETFVTEQTLTPERVIKKKPQGALPGVDHPRHNRKLTDEDVLFIRRQLTRDGVFSADELAIQYDVHIQTIHDIRAARSWKHLGAC
jgi:hypothetical protein